MICLQENTKVLEYVLYYAISLLDLEGDHGEDKFEEEFKLASMYITWPKWPFLHYWLFRQAR